MDLFPKIQSIYKRGERGKFLLGQFATPALAYLAGLEWEWTEKVDGTNIRIGMVGDGDGALLYQTGGRTERAEIPKHLASALAALDLADRLHEMACDNDTDTAQDVVLYGEGYGAKIQKGGGNYREDQSFVLFDVQIGGWWLRRAGVLDVGAKLGLDVVPIVGRGPLVPQSITGPPSAEEAAREGFKSAWGDFEAEGLVCRPTVQLWDRKGDPVVVKLKTKDYRRLES